jgi:hypothetical protein
LERRKTHNKTSYATLWEGLYHGHIGLFPFRCIGAEDKQFDPNTTPLFWAVGTQQTIQQDNTSIQPSRGKLKIVKALYSYTGRDSEEMSFEKGDKIIILKEHSEWPKGSNLRTGQKGLVPSNYVQ